MIDTKQQLTEIERNFLWKNIPAKSNKQTIITGQAEAPEQVQLGVRIIRDDLKSTREKPDVIILYKVSETIADEKSLLNSFTKTLEELWNRSLYDQLYGRENIISIKDTEKKHKVWSLDCYLYILYEAVTQFPVDLVTFTEEILNGKLHFFMQCNTAPNVLWNSKKLLILPAWIRSFCFS